MKYLNENGVGRFMSLVKGTAIEAKNSAEKAAQSLADAAEDMEFIKKYGAPAQDIKSAVSECMTESVNPRFDVVTQTIAAEATRAKAAEAENSAAVVEETARAKSAEATNKARIDTEATKRSEDVANLNAAISAGVGTTTATVEAAITTASTSVTNAASSKAVVDFVAEQNASIDTKVTELEKTINGEEKYEKDIDIEVTAGSSITTDKYDCTLEANKEYAINILFNNCASVLATYFYDESGNVVGGTVDGDTFSADNGVSCTPTVNPRKIVLNSNVYKVKIYINGSYITTSGTITAKYITAKGDDGLVEKVQELTTTVANKFDKPSNIGTEGQILSLDESGSAKWIDNDAVALKEEVDGKSGYSKTLSVAVSPSESLNKTLDLSLESDKEYTITPEFSLLSEINLYFYDASGNAVGGTVDGGTFTTYLYFTSANSPRKVICNSPVSKVQFYTNSPKISGTGDEKVLFTANDGTTGLAEDVASLKLSIKNLNTGDTTVGSGSAMAMRDQIKSTRAYYFGTDGWRDSATTSYLDEKIKDIPEGKHFLMFTDIHLDYAYVNASGSYNQDGGLVQNLAPIMKYVKDRLGCKVLFGGDYFGAQSEETVALNEMKWFSDEYYSAFGDDFVPSHGDHDDDLVSGGLTSGVGEVNVYNQMFKPMRVYGKAVFDEIGINAVDNVSEIPSSEKDAWKAWMGLHYYMDDVKQKIRYIIYEGEGSFAVIENGWMASKTQVPFIAKAIESTPSGYDVVVLCHEWGLSDTTWNTIGANHFYNEVFKLMTAFKQKTTATWNVESLSYSETLRLKSRKLAEAIVAGYGGTGGILSVDYSGSTGRTFMVSGDKHFDDAFLIGGTVTNNTVPATEYRESGITDSKILAIIFDRCCLTQESSYVGKGIEAFDAACPNAASYPDHSTSNYRLGTTNEALFDIVTLTDDNKVVCTRFGAGSSREYNLPVIG